MFDCLILGDSIAKGISDVRKDCVAYVQSGINSPNYLNKFGSKVDNASAQVVLISLGSNDLKDATYEAITKLRDKFPEGQIVYWVLPNIKETVRRTVWHVAHDHGDFVIDARGYDRSPDHVHPTYRGYKDIAKEFK
jgi:lysophospholipase L1-like esterase